MPVLELLSSTKRLTGDAWKLMELQGQLFQLDLQCATKQSRLPLVTLVAGGLAIMAALPLVLWAVADGLSIYLGLQLWQSLLLVGFAVLLLGAILVLVSLLRLSRVKQVFSRSFGELDNNLRWIKGLFSEQGQ